MDPDELRQAAPSRALSAASELSGRAAGGAGANAAADDDDDGEVDVDAVSVEGGGAREDEGYGEEVKAAVPAAEARGVGKADVMAMDEKLRQIEAMRRARLTPGRIGVLRWGFLDPAAADAPDPAPFARAPDAQQQQPAPSPLAAVQAAK